MSSATTPPSSIRFFPLVLLAVLAAAYVVPSLEASFRHHYQRNYNEGWNTYRIAAVSGGRDLYGAPPGLTPTNYPPVSFYMAGGLTGLGLTPLMAGRVLATVGFLATGAMIAWLVLFLSSSAYAACLVSLLFALSVALIAPDYVALNDPQMIAHAIVLAGLALALGQPSEVKYQIAGGLIVCIGLFTKHNIIALPAAYVLWLAYCRRWRPAVAFCGAGCIAALALIVVIRAVDGPYLFEHLANSRRYSLGKAVLQTSTLLAPLGILIVAGLGSLYAIREPRQRMLMTAAVACAAVVGIGAAGGFGVWVNTYFELIITLCVATGAGVAALADRVRHVHAIAAMAFVLTFTLHFPARVGGNYLPKAKAHDEAVSYLASTAGPAICENLLMCFEAGKPLVYDMFNGNELFATGRQSETAFLDSLKRGHFAAIQLNGPPGEFQQASPRERMSRLFMETLLENYQLGASPEGVSIFTPRGSKSIPPPRQP